MGMYGVWVMGMQENAKCVCSNTSELVKNWQITKYYTPEEKKKPTFTMVCHI